jgi:hypothetical protein
MNSWRSITIRRRPVHRNPERAQSNSERIIGAPLEATSRSIRPLAQMISSFSAFLYRNTVGALLTGCLVRLVQLFGVRSTGDLIALLRITTRSNPLLVNRAFMSHCADGKPRHALAISGV